MYQSSKKAKRRQLSGEIGELEQRLDEERAQGRDIESLESGEDPLPCYSNSGCGLYRGGMTNLEIEAGTIWLVKRHNDGTLPPAEQREQYWEDGDLNAFQEQLRSA